MSDEKFEKARYDFTENAVFENIKHANGCCDNCIITANSDEVKTAVKRWAMNGADWGRSYAQNEYLPEINVLRMHIDGLEKQLAIAVEALEKTDDGIEPVSFWAKEALEKIRGEG